MPVQLNVGIIGTSGWTETMYPPTINSHPAGKVSAICGRTRSRAEQLAQKFEIPQVFTDYRAMIAEGNLDAIVIATPDDLHYEMTMAALDAGLHILCEKPLALNVEQARQMTARAEAAGVKHMVLFTWRWLPLFNYLKQLVDDGFVGRCYQANFRFIAGFGLSAEYSWRQDGTRANGVAADLGAHMIDFAHWFVGDVDSVNAHLQVHIDRPGLNGQPLVPTNDAGNMALKFTNGAQGMIQVSVVAHQTDRLMEIAVDLYGEDGVLESSFVPFGKQARMMLQGARKGGESFQHIELPESVSRHMDSTDVLAPFKHESIGPRHFIDAIVQDFAAKPDFADGLKVQSIIAAALLSARDGRWVSPNSV